MRDLLNEKKIVVYEVIPPKGVDTERCIKLCLSMLDAGVDAIAITDMPVGSVRIAPWAIGKILKDMGHDVLVHFTRTSRNVLRIESDLMGIWTLGIENVLLLSGDDPKTGDYPNATRVEDVSITDLIRLTKLMNSGTDLAGNTLKGSTNFFVGAVFNPLDERDIVRARGKIEAGVDFLVSQPVFKRGVEFDLGVPVIASVAFFKSERQMRYFSDVPGIYVPKRFFRDTKDAGSAFIKDYTFERMLEVIEDIAKRVSGFYIPGIVRDVDKVRRMVEFVESLQSGSE